MKKRIFFKIGLLLLLACSLQNCSNDNSRNLPGEDPVSLYTTPELYALTNELAAVFNKMNPDMEINVLTTTESALIGNLETSGSMSFVSGNTDSVVNAGSLWKVVVGRDIIVPIMNSENPLLDEVYSQGISPDGFTRILNNPESSKWGVLTGTDNNNAVDLIVSADPAIHSGIAKFLEQDHIAFDGVRQAEGKEVIAEVQDKRYAIGFVNLTDILDPFKHTVLENVSIVPIDINGNGYLDYKEDVYTSLDAFTRGVWIGKYPGALASNIYSVSLSHPTNKSEIAFLKWSITKGQVLLDNHGLSNLEENEKLAQLKWIDSYNFDRPGSGSYIIPKEPGFLGSPLTRILSIFLATLLLIILGIRFRNRNKTGIPVHNPVQRLAFGEDFVEILPGLCYDKTHTWAFMDEDGLVKVGIDDFLQRATGPLTRVKMKSPGERIKKGRQAVSIIQDGKQLDIKAPISGTIMELNEKLVSDADILNSSPFTEGWIYKIEPTNWLQEVQFLIMGTTYKDWLKTEFQRLKDFLAETLMPGTVGYAHVLQDGGELKESVLENLGPKVWEDFQTNFIDVSA